MADQQPSTRARRWETWVQVGAAVALTVVLCTVSELISAHCLAGLERDRRPAIPGADEALQRGRRFSLDNPVPLVRDAALLWRNMPGAEKTQPVYPRPFGRHDLWTAKLNSEGFRGPEREFRNQDDNVYRILCVGDSVTFGFNVDQDATFPGQLAEEVQRRDPSQRTEVINAGVIGWTWVQGARFVERYGMALHPNVIVIGHGANDQYWNVRITDREQMWLLERRMTRGAQAFIDFLTLSNTYRALVDLLPPPPPPSLSSACELQSWQTGGCHRVSLEEIETTVDHIRHLTTDAGIELIALNVDFLQTRSVEAVRRAVRRDGVPLLDEVRHLSDLRLSQEFERARELGLAKAHLPSRSARLLDETTGEPRGARILLRIQVGQPATVVSMKGAWTSKAEDFDFEARLYDDGTHGDEVAGDHVYSIKLQAPLGVGKLRYEFYVDGTPEFEARPPYPALWSARDVVFGDDGIAYIERFGDRFLMADGAHPDARGHQVIAADLLEQIERLPSFANFVEIAAGVS